MPWTPSRPGTGNRYDAVLAKLNTLTTAAVLATLILFVGCSTVVVIVSSLDAWTSLSCRSKAGKGRCHDNRDPSDVAQEKTSRLLSRIIVTEGRKDMPIEEETT